MTTVGKSGVISYLNWDYCLYNILFTFYVDILSLINIFENEQVNDNYQIYKSKNYYPRLKYLENIRQCTKYIVGYCMLFMLSLKRIILFIFSFLNYRNCDYLYTKHNCFRNKYVLYLSLVEVEVKLKLNL